MMKKETFVTIMDSLRDFWDKTLVLENILGAEFNECFMLRHMDSVLDALTDEMEDKTPKIYDPFVYDFAFNCNWGRDDCVSVWLDGVEHTASTPGELYDLIVLVQPLYDTGDDQDG